MTDLERDIERRLRLSVEALGGKCLKWVCPGWTGVPDRIILMPGGRVSFVETKRPKDGRLSAMQRWWHTQLEGMGFACLVIWDQTDLAGFLDYLQEQRRKA